MVLPYSAVGSSAVRDCGISCSYSLTFSVEDKKVNLIDSIEC